MIALPNTAARASRARPLLALVVALQFSHLAILLFVPHPLLLSNVLQLLMQFVTVWVCLAQLPFVPERVGRRCWIAVATAFGIWAAAQSCYIASLYLPVIGLSHLRLDDALWFLFGLPLLFAVITLTNETVDSVLWYDRLQAGLFFFVLFLLVFLPAVHLNMDTAFLVQDVALLLCCLLRLPSAKNVPELRFFLRLALYLAVYAPCTVVADLLHQHGWPPGTLIDLAWTVPSAFFCVLVLWHAISPWELGRFSRLVAAVSDVQGLSVTCLALLSMCVSAYLAMHVPLLGGVCMAASFGLFAVRTNSRERAWLQAHEQLEKIVLQDALTGLGNRIQLRNSLTERLVDRKTASSTVLLFADLDRFKSINDSLGHALGDRLLIDVGSRLRAASPLGAMVCRLGGDEFVVLTTAANAEDAQRCGETLLNALHLPFRLGTHSLRCTASIGVVLASAGEGVDDLLRTADHAMYRAKQLGKDRVQLFDASLLAQMSNRWQMEADLRDAVEEGDIEVAFQPILGVEDGTITGFEALARWSHPEHGAIPPAEFIPLAEETGLILSLGAQVLEKACYQVAEWNHHWRTRLTVSVNVSPRQFADSNLLAGVLDTLNRTGLEPALLRLEITESALLVHEGAVKQVLAQARAHGIRISLDDFGTGYSSLSFLLNLPVDEVKIDRSFVSDMARDPQRKELVRTVVQLGHSLGKRVVAEGVETEQDLHDLAAMGCECAQGWLIGRPLSADALEADMPSIKARVTRNPAVFLRAGGPSRALPQRVEDSWTAIPEQAFTSLGSVT